ncbi:Mn-dependent transcriptional regulator (plasmid) [Deinococcus peraridilitoris DSM 19664]|uniref:Manganese transport regulator n=1 Tax=Deinococcus peraridilitoris (strain DSM 19664 / LMG 22246 / CIP 109416 / KR-200) TaxID=937777 RepID=L0A717_DEIPD|nr:Mn-dependent transcriptional regulator [Deinococcus peraridilitoris DSM 19664]
MKQFESPGTLRYHKGVRERLTPQSEDCLKAIYLLSREGRAGTQDIAQALGITSASVTGMLKRLAELQLVSYQAYKGVELTAAGETVALEVLRHHRIIEAFLHRALGVPLEELHEEADRLEHHISESLEARLFAALGAPTHDPHGDPIPSMAGVMPREAKRSLLEVRAGEVVTVGRLAQNDAPRLGALAALGVVPGVMLEVLETEALGVMRVRPLEGEPVVLGTSVAEGIWVEDVEDEALSPS